MSYSIVATCDAVKNGHRLLYAHGAARAAARRRAYYTACSVRATLRACTVVAVPASGRPDGAPLAGSLGVRDGSQADEWLTVTGINSAPATPRAG
eukprot:COSAG06_NODE_32120_length_511_cov_0.628641_2_plen_94_part_01